MTDQGGVCAGAQARVAEHQCTMRSHDRVRRRHQPGVDRSLRWLHAQHDSLFHKQVLTMLLCTTPLQPSAAPLADAPNSVVSHRPPQRCFRSMSRRSRACGPSSAARSSPRSSLPASRLAISAGAARAACVPPPQLRLAATAVQGTLALAPSPAMLCLQVESQRSRRRRRHRTRSRRAPRSLSRRCRRCGAAPPALGVAWLEAQTAAWPAARCTSPCARAADRQSAPLPVLDAQVLQCCAGGVV